VVAVVEQAWDIYIQTTILDGAHQVLFVLFTQVAADHFSLQLLMLGLLK
jgi:hypothetical protein